MFLHPQKLFEILSTSTGSCGRVLAADKVSINDPKTGKTTLGTIENVIENESDPNYVRRNVLVKGAIIETNKGRVKITSRPGKDGVINGVLIE